MMEKFQLAYKRSHSTETALLHVFNDLTVKFYHDGGTLLAVQSWTYLFLTLSTMKSCYYILQLFKLW